MAEKTDDLSNNMLLELINRVSRHIIFSRFPSIHIIHISINSIYSHKNYFSNFAHGCFAVPSNFIFIYPCAIFWRSYFSNCSSTDRRILRRRRCPKGKKYQRHKRATRNIQLLQPFRIQFSVRIPTGACFPQHGERRYRRPSLRGAQQQAPHQPGSHRRDVFKVGNQQYNTIVIYLTG